MSSTALSTQTAGVGAGNGMLTFTVPGGVGAVGTEILDPYAAKNPGNGGQPSPYAVNLALYNNGTLLGTVTGTSDSNGDPIFLGASDSTGDNITSFSYSIASIGTPEVPAIPAIPAGGPIIEYQLSYDCNAGFTDKAFCKGLTDADGSNEVNVLQCPQKFLCPATGSRYLASPSAYTDAANSADGISPYISPIPLYQNPGTAGSPAIPATYDNNPAQLASFLIKSLHLRISRPAPTQAATAAACVGSGAGL